MINKESHNCLKCFDSSYLTDGALSVEVWGHQSAGFSKDSSIFDSESSQQVLQAYSLRDRWKDVKRQLQLSVEIQELDEQGNYSPVEVLYLLHFSQ